MKNNHKIFWGMLILFLTAALLLTAAAPRQADDPNPPDHVVKLIFIHHSTGENWLRDDYGGLGQALADNNYFVSDTNYSWGPDSIGDRTDIPNWTEWFTSANTPTYMDALFNESGQNSEYTRLPNDPGGENQIFVFKSCFPNSDLGGNPDDPPGTYEDMTVSGAKYVYNQILQYFASRQDKLFVVITAPPLRKADTSTENATNARAFNDWLVNDWLRENNYPYNNVAVFDFYNVLTGPDNHHRFVNGQIEHIYKPGMNTSHYPTEDSHPSAKGSQKATEEFIPLLNIFYNRWVSSEISNLPPATLSAPTAGSGSSPEPGVAGVPLPPETVLTIDDFEGGASDWKANWDASTSTTITCAIEQGTGSQGSVSLRIDFSIAPGSWGTCALSFDTPQDWSSGEWLAFDVHSEQSGLPFNVIIIGGKPDAEETYIQYRETPVEYPEGYIPLTSSWGELLRADWETNAGSPFEQPGQVLGLAFGFDGGQDTPYTGTIWIDNITLQKSPSYEGGGNPTERGGNPPEEGGNPPKSNLPCLGGALLPLVLAGMAWIIRRK
jgi:hypothetical protein